MGWDTDLDASGIIPPDLSAARAFADLGELDVALDYYGQLLRSGHAVPCSAWVEAAAILAQRGLTAAAETCLRRAILSTPSTIQARQALADLLAARMELGEAVDMYHEVLSIDPSHAPALAGLGQALISLGRLPEAEDQIERALILDAQDPVAHLGRARLNLLDGYFGGAWEDQSWRWRASGLTRPDMPGDMWDGNSDLSGSTILLWAEQDDAETLHLLRYVPLVARRGGNVLLAVPDSMILLAECLGDNVRLLISGSRPPSDIVVDYNAALADLPRLFDTNLGSIPPAPYLSAPDLPSHGGIPYCPPTAMLRVGVNWRGATRCLGLDFQQIMPLLGRPNVAFYSLCSGSSAADIRDHAHPALIHDLSKPNDDDDYTALAQRIDAMDLIITVDGPIAHLAGALGKPVWVMLSMAPDWRWLLNRDDSPWYGSARLFRQERPGDWTPVLTRIMLAMDDLADQELQRRHVAARNQIGDRATAKVILCTHVQSDDVVIDVGCGSGELVLDVADIPIESLAILAIEARQQEADLLIDTLGIMGLEDRVQVHCAAIGASSGPVVISPTPRCGGRTVFPLPAWTKSIIRQHRLDDLLAEQPDLIGRRIVLRLGKVGNGADILTGLGDLRPSVVTYCHSATDSQVATSLRDMGYSLYQFPDGVAAGLPIPFHPDRNGQVVALAADCPLPDMYGNVHDPHSLAAIARGRGMAAKLAVRGNQDLAAGNPNQAGAWYAKALAQDINNMDANANLGGLLRRIGRRHAAAACWTRALTQGAPPPLQANLGNLLRELGQFEEAEFHILKAMEETPDDPRLLVVYGLLERDRGRPRDAVALFERAERLSHGSVPCLEIATALLKSGNTARGMAELGRRPLLSQSPLDLPFWEGHRLDAQYVLVRDEGNLIDTITLARFIPQVARLGGLVSVECSPEAARLLGAMGCVEQAIPRGQPLPAMDIQVNLLDIPRLIGTTRQTTPLRDVPYLHLPHDVPPHDFPQDGRLHVGIAWSKSPQDLYLGIEHMLPLASNPLVSLFSLQQGPQADSLNHSGADMLMADLGQNCTDLADLAACIAGLDLVIAADTVQAHLAGAMGKPVWVLLARDNDWRWVDGRDDCIWYPTMRVFRQSADGSWDQAIKRINLALAAMAAGKYAARQ